MSCNNKLDQLLTNCWKDILNWVPNAAVYIDHEAVECLHWYTGDRVYLSFRDAGAAAINELTTYNINYDKIEGVKNVVIISSCTDIFLYERTIKLIILSNEFTKCTIICAMSNDNSNNTVLEITNKNGNVDIFRNNVISWMNANKPYEKCYAEIIFRPIFIAMINNEVFVTPPLAHFNSPLTENQYSEMMPYINHFVHSMHSLFTHLNLKDDIYSVGKFSNYVAEKLEKLSASSGRRNIAEDGVSLILVDRSLDLCTATCYNTESLLAKILCSLPHLPHHSNDVAVDMTMLCTKQENGLQTTLVPGCIATKNQQLLDLLISLPQREVLLKLNEIILSAAICKESPKTRVSTRITAHSLEKLIQKCTDNCDIDTMMSFSKKFQIILAIIQTLKSEKFSQLELLTSLEKLLLQNIASSRDSSTVLSQFSTIMKTRRNRGIDTENLLALLIHIYSLSGTQIKFSSDQFKLLKEAIVKVIFEDIKICISDETVLDLSTYRETLLLLGITSEEQAKEVSLRITEDFMQVLQTIAQQRSFMKDYKSFIIQSTPQEMAQCRGIIEQLTDDLLVMNKREFNDISKNTTSLTSTVSSLFSIGKAKYHPCDNPWVIIYVIGGITPDEVRIIKKIASSHLSNCNITLSGSKLLNPLDVVDTFLLPFINK